MKYKIQDQNNYILSKEIKLHVRKIVVQFLSQGFYVLRGRLMVGVESDENFAVGRADRRIVTKGEINPACGQPDVIENVLDFVRRNDFANHTTYLKKSLLGRFKPSACGSSHMQTKLAGIDRWEKVAAEKRNETTRDKHQRAHACKHNAPMFETQAQCIHIPCPKFFESVIEVLVNAREKFAYSREQRHTRLLRAAISFQRPWRARRP